jgi:hypothetical protein
MLTALPYITASVVLLAKPDTLTEARQRPTARKRHGGGCGA